MSLRDVSPYYQYALERSAEKAQEHIAKQDAQIATLTAQLSEVTRERDEAYRSIAILMASLTPDTMEEEA